MAPVTALMRRISRTDQRSASLLQGFDQIAVSWSSQRAIVSRSYSSTAIMTGEVVIWPPLLRWMM